MPAGSATMQVPVHWATPYLHVGITTDDDGMTLVDRRTVFGVLPVRRRRVTVGYGELADARIKNIARWSCLFLAVALAAAIALTGLPFIADVALGFVAILFGLMAFIRGIEVTRTDGRTWMFPICRTHEFDASIALLDALHRRDALHGAG
jgi:hypothetical protein